MRAPSRPATPTPESPAKALDNELIVALKPGYNARDVAAALGAKLAGELESFHAARLQFEDAAATEAARSALAANPGVAGVDSNYPVSRPPEGESLGSAASTLALKAAAGTKGSQLVVGLVDSVVQTEGTGLGDFLLPGVSVAGGAASDAGVLSHGTAMAQAVLQGIAMTQGGAGSSSVRILPVDIYGDSASTTTFQVAEGILSAIAGGARIINLSLGTPGDSSLVREIIQSAHAQGIVFIGAAGNEPVTTANFPAAYGEVIAVTALDDRGALASYANRGAFVDVAAPGTALVTWNGQSYLVSGTSTSAALASGIAAGFAERTKVPLPQVEQAIRAGLGVAR